MSDHHMFLAKLDGLDQRVAVFEWENDGHLVAAKVPREAWENAERTGVITVVLADLAGARIDDSEALAKAWDDGYHQGVGDAERTDDMRAVNPHWRRAR